MLTKYTYLTTLLAVSLVTRLFGQCDTIYVDKFDVVCDRNKAKDLLIYTKEGVGNYRIARHNIDNNNLVAMAHGTHSGLQYFVGPYVAYYPNGQKKEEGNYEKNEKIGDWNYYYDDSNLWYVVNYSDYELFSYYKNGKIKRHETTNQYKKTKATCYDEQGKKIKCTPFITIPTPGYNLPLYLYDNTRTRKKENDEIKSKQVVVRFSLDGLGNVNDVTLLKSQRSDLDSEAIRLVSMSGKWEPFKIDGYSEPINGLFAINAELLNNVDQVSIFSTKMKYCRYVLRQDYTLCVTCSQGEDYE